LPGAVEQAIRTLPQEQLLDLADAVLEVRGLEDLQAWLRGRGKWAAQVEGECSHGPTTLRDRIREQVDLAGPHD
jgi:hypothetical protein